jgi:2,4-diketo-3-deoxy-L-fuconate hydrolase
MQQFARILIDSRVVPVILRENEHLDLRSITPDITPDAIASGALANVDTAGLPPIRGEFTYVAPINGIRQIAATGFNYKKHIEEFKMKPPTEPEVFLKAISSLTGPFDPIFRGPNQGVKLDWEVGLAIVVGREARDISTAEAANYIFGYVCVNDISDRTTQVDEEGQQHLVRAKSRPSYSPIGPYLTTGIDGMKLDVWTKLNGDFEQRGNTSDMLFGVPEMLA